MGSEGKWISKVPDALLNKLTEENQTATAALRAAVAAKEYKS